MNKEKKLLISAVVVIFLLAGTFCVYAFMHKDKTVCKAEENDAVKFKREYEEFNDKFYDNTEIQYFDVNLSSNNVFKYLSAKDAVKFLKEGTGVIYFGFPQCPWCRTIVPYLNDAAKQTGVKEVKYLNILDIRDTYTIDGKKAVVDKKGTDEYYELLEVLDKHLKPYTISDDDNKEVSTGVKRLYAPTTVFVKEGKIVGFLEGTVDTQAKFVPLTDDEKEELTSNLNSLFLKVSSTVCSDKTC
ncbi:MAG: hypothetical protein K6G37_01495 [Bacilli bacterium]|nr:hypothetical protein [Bacilli bacterium]